MPAQNCPILEAASMIAKAISAGRAVADGACMGINCPVWVEERVAHDVTFDMEVKCLGYCGLKRG